MTTCFTPADFAASTIRASVSGWSGQGVRQEEELLDAPQRSLDGGGVRELAHDRVAPGLADRLRLPDAPDERAKRRPSRREQSDELPADRSRGAGDEDHGAGKFSAASGEAER